MNPFVFAFKKCTLGQNSLNFSFNADSDFTTLKHKPQNFQGRLEKQFSWLLLNYKPKLFGKKRTGEGTYQF